MQQKILNDRYELERKVGEGGMARVYLGRDLRLSRRVAVKVLHSQYASDPQFLARFNHEAQAAANLRHPGIIDIYDVGHDGDIPYIVMEFVEGQDLKALIRLNGSLPIERAVQITEQVADGLDAAHRAGLVHRDIKPQNIIIGENDRVKITDFGIAKSALSTSATETGVIFGTADYLSPEQARGLTATPASDIYSLGISLYEMLTGKLPFSGDNSVAVAMQHVSTAPVPPSRLNPRIPPQLESIVLSAIEKDPARRPASARAFAQLLRGYRQMGDQGTVVRPATPRPVAVPATDATVIAPQPTVSNNQQPRPQPRPRPVNTGTTAPRAPLPQRSAVPAPRQSGGLGFGGFLLGLLLIGGVLALVALLLSGALSGLLPSFGGGPRPTAEPVIPTAAPIEGTAVPLAIVPNVVGLDSVGASATITGARLTPQADSPINSDTVASGVVIDQFPDFGQTITETSVVTYVVSLGPAAPETVEIPDVTRQREDAATSRLQRDGFVVERREEASTTDEGFVIRVSPSPGLFLPKGSTVVIVVSIGNKVTVPNIFRLPEAQARAQIEAVGLVVGNVNTQGRDILGDQFDQFEAGTVVSNDPRGGTVVERGSTVNIAVRAAE